MVENHHILQDKAIKGVGQIFAREWKARSSRLDKCNKVDCNLAD